MKPVNGYLLVRMVEVEQENNSLVLLPEGMKTNDSPFAVVELLKCGSKSDWHGLLGHRLLVPSRTVENFTFENQTHYLVLENHVIAYFDN